MKKFFLYIVFVLVVLFVSDKIIATLFDVLYKKIRTGQTGGKINYYLSKPTPEIVIMGNSRSFYQIIPDIFRCPTFNLSHAGQTQVFQTGLLSIMKTNQKLPPLFYFI